MATKMTHASLFSGIGGFEVAADWAGFENLFNCEIDPFCRAVLHYHYPNAIQYVDIRNTDFIPWRGRIDVLTGGFPCQPFSIAGKRKGTEDNRYLWPQMLRAIHEIRPGWVVGENVLGIVNWSQGLVFEQVCADLEIEGYEVQPYILPACGVGAPHQRYRTWFVAHLCSNTNGKEIEDLTKPGSRKVLLPTPTRAMHRTHRYRLHKSGATILQGRIYGECCRHRRQAMQQWAT